MKLTNEDKRFLKWITAMPYPDVPMAKHGDLILEIIAIAIDRSGGVEPLARETGLSARSINRIVSGNNGRGGSVGGVKTDTLERLARIAGREHDLSDLIPEFFGDEGYGEDGWGPYGRRHCDWCGTWFHGHAGAGLCTRCFEDWLANDGEQPERLWFEDLAESRRKVLERASSRCCPRKKPATTA